jgi:signal transduction histidine kinase
MQGDLDNALKQFELCYRLAIEGKKLVDQVLALQNIGLVYKEKADYQNALKYLNEGVQLANKYGLKEEGLRVAIIIPAVLTEQKKYSEAEQELKKYLNQSLKLEIIDLSSEIYDNLIDIAKEKGDYKLALAYFQQNTELKEKQINQQKERALAEANASLSLYVANQKILESETLLFQKTREKNILIIGLIFSLIITIGLFIVLYRLKKLNHALIISKTELTESNNIKNKLFSIIGHDLRGSQSTTLGVLGLIEDDELDPIEQKKYIKTIIKQTKSSLAILDDLLLWGQAQIKGKSLEKDVIFISPVVQSTLDLNLKTILEKSLSIKPNDLSEKSVFMDKNHFSFVVRNLIANAIKFTPSGGEIEIKVESHSNTQYKISIADNGIGIPDEELKNIFTPDSKSRKGTKDEKGTGLGLTLCNEFVRANGGEIWAEKNFKKGTILCFTVDKGV